MVDGYISPEEDRKRQRALRAERDGAARAAGREYAAHLHELVARARELLVQTRPPDRMIEVRYRSPKLGGGTKVRPKKPVAGWLIGIDDLTELSALAIGKDGRVYAGEHHTDRKAVVCQGRIDLASITWPGQGLTRDAPAFTAASIEAAVAALLSGADAIDAPDERPA